MTWEEFVNSDFNIDNLEVVDTYRINGEDIHDRVFYGHEICFENNNQVEYQTKDDEIIPERHYFVMVWLE